MFGGGVGGLCPPSSMNSWWWWWWWKNHKCCHAGGEAHTRRAAAAMDADARSVARSVIRSVGNGAPPPPPPPPQPSTSPQSVCEEIYLPMDRSSGGGGGSTDSGSHTSRGLVNTSMANLFNPDSSGSGGSGSSSSNSGSGYSPEPIYEEMNRPSVKHLDDMEKELEKLRQLTRELEDVMEAEELERKKVAGDREQLCYRPLEEPDERGRVRFKFPYGDYDAVPFPVPVQQQLPPVHGGDRPLVQSTEKKVVENRPSTNGGGCVAHSGVGGGREEPGAVGLEKGEVQRQRQQQAPDTNIDPGTVASRVNMFDSKNTVEREVQASGGQGGSPWNQHGPCTRDTCPIKSAHTRNAFSANPLPPPQPRSAPLHGQRLVGESTDGSRCDVEKMHAMDGTADHHRLSEPRAFPPPHNSPISSTTIGSCQPLCRSSEDCRVSEHGESACSSTTVVGVESPYGQITRIRRTQPPVSPYSDDHQAVGAAASVVQRGAINRRLWEYSQKQAERQKQAAAQACGGNSTVNGCGTNNCVALPSFGQPTPPPQTTTAPVDRWADARNHVTVVKVGGGCDGVGERSYHYEGAAPPQLMYELQHRLAGHREDAVGCKRRNSICSVTRVDATNGLAACESGLLKELSDKMEKLLDRVDRQSRLIDMMQNSMDTRQQLPSDDGSKKKKRLVAGGDRGSFTLPRDMTYRSMDVLAEENDEEVYFKKEAVVRPTRPTEPVLLARGGETSPQQQQQPKQKPLQSDGGSVKEQKKWNKKILSCIR